LALRIIRPSAAIYVFAHDHPDAVKSGINIMMECLPNGERIRRPGIRPAAKH
jgi:hypothetical protein